MPNGVSSPCGDGHQHHRPNRRAQAVRHIPAQNDRRHRGNSRLHAFQRIRRLIGLASIAWCGAGTLARCLLILPPQRHSPAHPWKIHEAAFSSNSAADPSFTELNKSPPAAHTSETSPSAPRPRARGPREISTCSKIAGAAATTCGSFDSRIHQRRPIANAIVGNALQANVRRRSQQPSPASPGEIHC